jgi:Carboxypeptidase regulatory-like domain
MDLEAGRDSRRQVVGGLFSFGIRNSHRIIAIWIFVLSLTVLSGPLHAQSDTASISGTIVDRQGGLVPDAQVSVVNTDTNVTVDTKTNNAGVYDVPALKPGHYRILVSKEGFKQIDLRDVTLNIQDSVNRNFTLDLGGTSETVVVNGSSGLNINTTDASVSTVVDRNFVETMPLNGRSFQSLILLAPGVVTNSPQSGAEQGESGEFSVNGQRTDSNYYTVDGVSANTGAFAAPVSEASSSGGLPAATALGSTQAIVSVDALQEFRINTSTYSAEYGRQPGGQIQFETRSGTNQFHGTAFDYLRNTVFDANNWFNDYAHVAKPAERQNDFGGVLGGPLSVPGLYSGKDRTFFFVSYEGLRLSQPEPATVSYVPTISLRNSAPTALQPVLKAFPLPNCTVAQDPQCIDDSVEGLSPYIVSTSLPSSVDSISVRADQVVAPWLRLFFRYGDTKSSGVQNITVWEGSEQYRTQSYTLGADGMIFGSLSNQFRFNYSPTHALTISGFPTLGGGTPADLQALQGLSGGQTIFGLFFTNQSTIGYQGHYGTPQHQWNLVDTVGWLRGHHSFRAGIDYRRTTSYLNAGSFSNSPTVEYFYLSPDDLQSNSVDFVESLITARQDPAYTNFSAFIQDEWRIKPRVSLSLGMRWELNPPPSVVSGAPQRTVNGNINNPASLTLAPVGTPLYKTTYYNFAPRLGLAALLHGQPGHETILRAGGGVFYDLGQQFDYLFGGGYSPGTGIQAPYGSLVGTSASFPLPLNLINVPLSESLTPPYGNIELTSRHLQLPYTYQWNVALEQALGNEQSVSVSYVGSNGRRLLEEQQFSLASLNPEFTTIYRYENGLSSSYNALQTQYKRRLSHGLQALASYTWSHALDFQSADNGLLPYQRGNSDFDVRNSLTAALSYDVPNSYDEAWKRALFSQWGTDLRFTARTAFPVEIRGPELTNPATGSQYYGLLNYNSDVPLYIDEAGAPGGRVVNPAAFSTPLAGEQGDAPRNFVRGFGENEINLAIRREFPIHDQVHLLFRAEAFNLLNHPNFGAINATCGNPAPGSTCTNPTFGQATSTLASSLGVLTPLYQQGGPRSFQFALKLLF